MYAIIGAILAIAYFIWISRLINFAVQTATRIAIATEVSANNLAIISHALPPQAAERAEAAMAAAKAVKAQEQETVRQANVPFVVAAIITAVIAFAYLLSKVSFGV